MKIQRKQKKISCHFVADKINCFFSYCDVLLLQVLQQYRATRFIDDRSYRSDAKIYDFICYVGITGGLKNRRRLI